MPWYHHLHATLATGAIPFNGAPNDLISAFNAYRKEVTRALDWLSQQQEQGVPYPAPDKASLKQAIEEVVRICKGQFPDDDEPAAQVATRQPLYFLAFAPLERDELSGALHLMNGGSATNHFYYRHGLRGAGGALMPMVNRNDPSTSFPLLVFAVHVLLVECLDRTFAPNLRDGPALGRPPAWLVVMLSLRPALFMNFTGRRRNGVPGFYANHVHDQIGDALTRSYTGNYLAVTETALKSALRMPHSPYMAPAIAAGATTGDYGLLKKAMRFGQRASRACAAVRARATTRETAVQLMRELECCHADHVPASQLRDHFALTYVEVLERQSMELLRSSAVDINGLVSIILELGREYMRSIAGAYQHHPPPDTRNLENIRHRMGWR